MLVLGWYTGPRQYPPHQFLSWAGRVDDPRSNLAEPGTDNALSHAVPRASPHRAPAWKVPKAN
jgi:hypothetical protein